MQIPRSRVRSTLSPTFLASFFVLAISVTIYKLHAYHSMTFYLLIYMSCAIIEQYSASVPVFVVKMRPLSLPQVVLMRWVGLLAVLESLL